MWHPLQWTLTQPCTPPHYKVWWVCKSWNQYWLLANHPNDTPHDTLHDLINLWEELTTSFINNHDPSQNVDFLYSPTQPPHTNSSKPHFLTPLTNLSPKYHTGLFARLNLLFFPHCFTSVTAPLYPLIMDAGASVCISPDKDDFILSTNRPS